MKSTASQTQKENKEIREVMPKSDVFVFFSITRFAFEWLPSGRSLSAAPHLSRDLFQPENKSNVINLSSLLSIHMN